MLSGTSQFRRLWAIKIATRSNPISIAVRTHSRWFIVKSIRAARHLIGCPPNLGQHVGIVGFGPAPADELRPDWDVCRAKAF